MRPRFHEIGRIIGKCAETGAEAIIQVGHQNGRIGIAASGLVLISSHDEVSLIALVRRSAMTAADEIERRLVEHSHGEIAS